MGNSRKPIAILYLVGGAFGAITSLAQLNGVSLGFFSAFAWLILLVQIGAALYGGWQFWNSKPIGTQILYWLSWSCVPVLSCSFITYWCAIGFGIFPTVSIGGGFGTDFSFHFGYASQLWFNSDASGLMLGANLVAIVLVGILGKTLKETGVPTWPLVLNKT